jgi:hypothetical protein
MLVGTAMTGTLSSPPTTLSSHNNHNACLRQFLPNIQQTMNSGNTHIIGGYNIVPHQSGGKRCLFCYRYIRSSGADNINLAVAVHLCILGNEDGSGGLMELRFLNSPADKLECRLIGASDQNIRFLREETFDNRHDLLRLFARSEDDLGKTMAQRSVVIDARKTKILERQILQSIKALLWSESSKANLLKKLQYLL